MYRSYQKCPCSRDLYSEGNLFVVLGRKYIGIFYYLYHIFISSGIAKSRFVIWYHNNGCCFFFGAFFSNYLHCPATVISRAYLHSFFTMDRLMPEQRLQISKIYFQSCGSVRETYRLLRPFLFE